MYQTPNPEWLFDFAQEWLREDAIQKAIDGGIDYFNSNEKGGKKTEPRHGRSKKRSLALLEFLLALLEFLDFPGLVGWVSRAKT